MNQLLGLTSVRVFECFNIEIVKYSNKRSSCLALENHNKNNEMNNDKKKSQGTDIHFLLCT